MTGASEAFPWAVIPASVGVILALVNLWQGSADSLRKAERLSDLVEGMVPSAERRLLEELRDEYAVRWALKRVVSRHRWLFWGAVAAFSAGLVYDVVFFAAAFPVPASRAPWSIYWVGLAFLAIGEVLAFIRYQLRKTWIQQERRWRWIPDHAPSAR